MSLNDPFGRVSRNDRRAYATLRARLQEEGIRNAEGVARMQANMRRAGLRFAAVITAATLCLALVFPRSGGVIVVFGILALAWLAANYLQTRAYLRRYLREDCTDAQP